TGPARRAAQGQGMEADPCGPGRCQRGVTLVEPGQVGPRGLEGAGYVVDHGRERELGQDLGVPGVSPYVARESDGLVDQGRRRVRVASRQQQLRPRWMPAPAGCGQPELLELLEPLF